MRAAFALAMVLTAASTAAAQDGEIDPPPARARPTSGEPSLSSGRTNGVGEVLVAAAAGWPGIWAQVDLAITSSFNLGIRGGLTYGAPALSVVPAVGGELSIPIRIHLHGEDVFDLAAYVTPAITAGEAAGVGETGVFGGDFGWSSRLELGGLAGWRLMERFTLLVGLGGHVGFVHTPDVGDPEIVGGVLARLGVEGLISRDTMLFAVAEGGLGFAPERSGLPVFGEPFPPILRVALGVAYLL